MTDATTKPERVRSSDSTGNAETSNRILAQNDASTTLAARTEPTPEPTHLVMTNPYAAAGVSEGQFGAARTAAAPTDGVNPAPTADAPKDKQGNPAATADAPKDAQGNPVQPNPADATKDAQGNPVQPNPADVTKDAQGNPVAPPPQEKSWYSSAAQWAGGALDVAGQVVAGAAESAYTQITEHPGQTLLHVAEGVAVGVAIVAAAPVVGALGAGAAVVGGVALAADAAIVGMGVVGAIGAGSEVVSAARNASSAADVLMHQDSHSAEEIAAARKGVRDTTGAAAVDAAASVLGAVGGVASGARVVSAARGAVEGTVAAGEALAARLGGRTGAVESGGDAAESSLRTAGADKPPDKYGNHFTPEQVAKIEDMQKTQDSMPVTKQTPEETKAVVDKLYGDGAETKGKRLDIVIGAPGSGKSSLIAEPIAKANGSMIVDSDLAKLEIPGHAGGLGADAVHEASTKVALDQLERGFQNGDNMVALKLGRTEKSLEGLIKRARDAGYEVNLHVAELPVSEFVKRTYNRAFPPDGSVGQWVNPSIPVDVGTKPIETFHSLISRPGYIDNYSHFDTDVPRGQPAILIKEGSTKQENAA